MVATTIVVAGQRRLPAASACEWEDVERIVGVGDVHGAFDRFLEILRTTKLVGADGHWIGGTTHFVQLGDVLDRGVDSRKALDLLRRLEPEAIAAGGRVHALLGNHEVMRVLGDLRYVTPGEYAAFTTPDSETARRNYLASIRNLPERDKALQDTTLGFVEMRLAFGREGDYGRWLRQRPVAVKINGVFFVHGGISSATASLGCDRMNQRVRRELTNDLDKTRLAPLDSLSGRADGPLWYRGLAQEPDGFAPQVDEILEKLHARVIVIAHTVTADRRIVTRFGGRVVEIDTGMQPTYIQGGRASALEIRHDEAAAVYVDRRDPVEFPKRATRTEGDAPGQPVSRR